MNDYHTFFTLRSERKNYVFQTQIAIFFHTRNCGTCFELPGGFCTQKGFADSYVISYYCLYDEMFSEFNRICKLLSNRSW